LRQTQKERESENVCSQKTLLFEEKLPCWWCLCELKQKEKKLGRVQILIVEATRRKSKWEGAKE
jgi:hypothetical protein